MRKGFALSAVSIGVLVACGPTSIDLGGGSGGKGQSHGGSAGAGYSTGGSVGGVGGAYQGTGGAAGTGTGYCGDGIVQFPETCDDGGEGECSDCGLPHAVGGAGGAYSTGGGPASGGVGGGAETVCGDGIIQYPEVCDDPSGLSGCPFNCGGAGSGNAAGGSAGNGYGGGAGASSLGFCGDGVLASWEACDDGNTLDGDGCPADCGYMGAAGTGGGGAPPYGGAGGTYGSSGSGSYLDCNTDFLAGSGECVDNDVLLGQGYERCQQLGRVLTAVRFTSPCGNYGSLQAEVDCCYRPDGGVGGSAGMAACAGAPSGAGRGGGC